MKIKIITENKHTISMNEKKTIYTSNNNKCVIKQTRRVKRQVYSQQPQKLFFVLNTYTYTIVKN